MDYEWDTLWQAVDGVILINLDSRADRRAAFMENVGRHIPPQKLRRLSAVLGRELPGYGQAPWFAERTGERAGYWAGVAGCTLSHRNAIRLAREEGWRRVLILEDDVVLTPQEGAAELLGRALQQLHGPYALYWGYNRPVPHGSRFMDGQGLGLWRVDGALAAHAYMLSAEVYDLLLDHLPADGEVWEWVARYRAVDTFYMDYLSAGLGVAVYALYPTLFEQGGGASDIVGGSSEDAACRRPPYETGGLRGLLYRLFAPLRRLKVRLNALRTLRRARRGGLPGYRRRTR